MRVLHEKSRRVRSKSRRPLKPQVRSDIQFIMATAKEAERSKRRFGLYDYLVAVYSVLIKWDVMGATRKRTREIAECLKILSPNVPPIRVLIEATLPNAGAKQKSRWTRALQFASHEDVPAERILRFFRRNGGVAGCASLGAKSSRKQTLVRRWS